MSNEHNPVAQLVTKIQQKWLTEVSPYSHLQWIRWIIRPDQVRLYEGFLRLESTSNGVIPDIPIVMLTAFDNSNIHSKNIIKDWLDNYEKDTKVQDQLSQRKEEIQWDKEYFRSALKKPKTNFDALLLELLERFQDALPDTQQHLILSLFPYTVQSSSDYKKWMDKLLHIGLPNKTRLMVFDHSPEHYFEEIQIKYKEIGKSISVELDLEGAMKKLALSGDPNDPEVQFRQCMLEMGNSTSKNNRKRLHHWGEKGLEVTQKTGSKAFYATAHTVYAGMLFHFKEFDTIDKLLNKALTIAKQGVTSGDETAKPIILQTYGFMAASMQHQKKIDSAVELFCKQANIAVSYKMSQQALSAYVTAYTLIKKKNVLWYQEIVAKAYNFGITLMSEELKTSPISNIALAYFEFSNKKKQEKIDSFMTNLESKNWKEKLSTEEKQLKTSISK
ncbi:hypothetical protein [uncultured Maribacter sp.]|uniref:hypothetical protein n=1 Tax=uncultured Maribacter sp. TaxID=431308 RepID=UPI00260D4DF6|nr:hypothetical protein [uncultured Maribacter sp.]